MTQMLRRAEWLPREMKFPSECRAPSPVAILVRTVAGGVRFDVRVQPRASRSEIIGEHDRALRVRLAAPPVDGAANEALVELIAKALQVAKRDVRIVAGAASRRKVLEVDGVTPEQVLALSSP